MYVYIYILFFYIVKQRIKRTSRSSHWLQLQSLRDPQKKGITRPSEKSLWGSTVSPWWGVWAHNTIQSISILSETRECPGVRAKSLDGEITVEEKILHHFG